MSKPMIEINNVSKEYRLGAIGGKTLNAEIQTKLAKLMGKEDPNSKIGARQHEHNEKFMALDGVSFSVQPGEAVGIIGHNGAGKSTLLKLISRVTAPSGGDITLRGRVASMLEVGTGFHPELTGRENVYLNGAILGMTKAEIDRNFDDIVEFAEMKQFIDTPVKRYSSGMYVKLAFSVAAHLDSEIMIMDEVLAVGDAKFQNKCLSKMSDEANNSGKTILYVSHNMGTIQRLCSRCVVLEKGKLIFDGATDEAIALYLSHGGDSDSVVDLSCFERNQWVTKDIIMEKISIQDKSNCIFLQNSSAVFDLEWRTSSTASLENVVLRTTIFHQSGCVAAFSTIGLGNHGANEINSTRFSLDFSGLYPGNYYINIDFNEVAPNGSDRWNDSCEQALNITIDKNSSLLNSCEYPDYSNMIPWKHSTFGCVRMNTELLKQEVNFNAKG